MYRQPSGVLEVDVRMSVLGETSQLNTTTLTEDGVFLLVLSRSLSCFLFGVWQTLDYDFPYKVVNTV